MNPVFLDSGYLVALENTRDEHHLRARKHWQSFSRSLIPILTTSYVLDEAVTYLNSRGHHAKAVEIGTRLLTSPSTELVHVDEELFRSGWSYFTSRPDKRFSLTDCISFVLMRQRDITDALAFDAHFTQAGFRTLP